MSDVSNQIFRQLHDLDLKFGTLRDGDGQMVELSHSSRCELVTSPKLSVRKRAFQKFYRQFEAHKNAFSATLGASVQRDVFDAKVRNFSSALECALFKDNVPVGVYDNLIHSSRKHLSDVYRYYDLRKRKLRVSKLHAYDLSAPLVPKMQKRYTWNQAVKTIMDSLEPLGDKYCSILHEGLTTGRWCDRYPNQGKESGGFASWSYDGPQYILLNYQSTLGDVFALAHEAGHAMHWWHSARSQPFQYYICSILANEVASIFNEQLLTRHLIRKAVSNEERAYLIDEQINRVIGTIISHAMFAEFEKIIHALVENGEQLTVDALRSTYRKLKELYHGPGVTIDKELELQCLRVPHLYQAFDLYKYALGLATAIALSERITRGGSKELNDYLGFLKGGCSKWPLDLLRDAGVDLRKPQVVDTALTQFGQLVSE